MMTQQTIAEDDLAARIDIGRIDVIRQPRTGPWAQRLLRHPVASAVALSIAAVAALGLYPALVGDDVAAHTKETWGLLFELVVAGLVVALVAALGWWREVGFTGPSRWRALHLLWLPVLMLAARLLTFILSDAKVADDGRWLTAAVPYMMVVGFLEELVMRGLVLFLLLHAWRNHKHGVLRAVVVSSVLFGLAHLLNLHEQAVGETLVQVGFATMLGIGLAGLALRTNTIWLGIVWHGLFDVIAELQTGPNPPDDDSGGAIGSLIFALPMLIYGLLVLRKR